MIKEISVILNLSKKPGNMVAAVGDVGLDLGDAGRVTMCGFRVMTPEGKPPWVAPPARHGASTWFDSVRLQGPLKKLVESAVLDRFDQLTKSRSRA